MLDEGSVRVSQLIAEIFALQVELGREAVEEEARGERLRDRLQRGLRVESRDRGRSPLSSQREARV